MKQFEFQELGQNDFFDLVTIYENVLFTQAYFCGDWQKKLGRTAKKFLVNDSGKEITYSDFFDVVVNEFWYRIYNFRKRIKKISL